jgi:hypothetical protein
LGQPPGRVSHRFSVENRKSEYATNMSFWSNGVDWVRSLRKINSKFVCSKSRYNSTPGRVLRRCSIENRNSENATNMSFGSNGVDWVRSLRKIQQQLFCSKSRYNEPPGRVSHRFSVQNGKSENAINMSFGSTSRASFAPFFHRKPKVRIRNQHEFLVKRGGLGAFVAENSTGSFFVQKSL